MRPQHLTFALAATVATFGCVPQTAVRVPRYQEPTPGEPHALVRIRAVYHTAPGPRLTQSLLHNGQKVALIPTEDGARTAAATAVRVPPDRGSWVFSSTFTHVESYLASEPYTKRVPYTTTKRYVCGGAGKEKSYCTRTETGYRAVTRYRAVTHQRTVVDGSCETELRTKPRRNAVYLLQYDYYGSGQCEARCYEEIPGEGGAGNRLVPCAVDSAVAKAN